MAGDVNAQQPNMYQFRTGENGQVSVLFNICIVFVMIALIKYKVKSQKSLSVQQLKEHNTW